MLLPSEETAMLALLEEAKVPIKRRSFDPKKLTPLAGALTSLLAKDDDLKQLAQGAFVMYLKATFLSPNKAVFDVSKLAAEDFAASMGLPTAPRIRLVKKLQKQAAKSQAKRAAKGGGDDVEDGGDEASDASEDAMDGDASDSDDAVEALAVRVRHSVRHPAGFRIPASHPVSHIQIEMLAAVSVFASISIACE